MALVTGTAEADRLVGTGGDDTLTSSGTSDVTEWDVMIGRNGADTYDLYNITGGTIKNFIIDDRGSDGALDRIVNAGALYQSASLGYSAWASATREGANLVLHLPSKPYRFRDPAKPEYNIRIVDHYADAAVESITAGGVAYQLATGDIGSAVADIMAGADIGDTVKAKAGNDVVFGNGGNDLLKLGTGDDTAFGGDGKDKIVAGSGNDRVYGGAQNDVIKGNEGNDWIHGEAGYDRIRAGDGADYVTGDAGSDRIWGDAGADTLNGGLGDDRLVGGKAGDLYQFDRGAPGEGWGHDTIRDVGNKASYLNEDTIELRGFYGASSGTRGEAYDGVSFARDGLDMVIAADGVASSITVVDMFHDNHNRFFIENLEFNGAYWEPLSFKFRDGGYQSISDDRDNGDPLRPSIYNEVLFGTDAADAIFGGVGTNFVWTGAGEDVLIYKRGDAGAHGDYVRAVSHDIVEDFDIGADVLDFREVATTFGALTLGEDADGDATIQWSSGTIEEANILIELRGVALADVTEDLFLF